MPTFDVHVTIENKSGISDPEGDTILNDLILRGTYKTVSRIRTAKMLKFTVQEENRDTALSSVQKICDELRIYNPMVSVISLDCSQHD